MLARSVLCSIGSVKFLAMSNPWFSDEFKLNNPPSEYDAGFRKMFNLETNDRNYSSLICFEMDKLNIMFDPTGEAMLPFDEEQQLNKSPLDEETLLSGQFWGELRVFLAVAKTKSFNRAAEITNTSQPTVSRQVKRLQDAVGSQLFISTPRGVKLTQKGEALARALSRLDHTLFSITSDLKAESREAEGTVRVSITDGLNALFAAPALVQFSEQYPKIQLHLKESAQP